MTSSRRKEQFLPYAYRKNGLEISNLSVSCSNGELVGLIDLDRHLVDLSGSDSDRFVVRGELSVTSKTVEEVFPATEHAQPPGYLVVLVRSASTHTRGLIEVSSAPCLPACYPFSVTIERANYLGSIELIPFLLRGEETKPGAPGFGSVSGMRLASSRPWEIRIDAASSVAGEFLEVRYQSFKEHAERFTFCANVFDIDCGGEKPILWLNSDHPRVCEVLNSRANTGIVARIRDVMFDQVSVSVWTQLFINAAWDLRDADDSTYRWQHAVLQKFLPGMYTQAGDFDERADLMRLDLEDGGMPLLLERFCPAVQSEIDLAKHFSNAATEVS